MTKGLLAAGESSDVDAQRAVERIAAARDAGAPGRAIELATLELNRRPPAEVETAIRIERARSFMRRRAWSEAERDCRRALGGRQDATAQALLAQCLLEQRRSAEAVEALQAALDDDSPGAWWMLYARALSAQGDHADACAAAERAEQRDPTLQVQRLNVLAAAGRQPDVIDGARRALVHAPQNAELWTLLGLSLDAVGHSSEAAAALHHALSLEPDRVDAHCGLGMALLRLGDYAAGFRHYEHRQRGAGRRRLGVPAWRGEPLAGKHVIVRAEQGLGDTIQFARFLPLLRDGGARTTFIVPPPLVRLLGSNPALGDVQGAHPPFQLGDYQTLVMSLPHHLGLGAGIDVAPVPFLFAEPALVQHWCERLPARTKVALAWQGNPSYAGDRWRSMPFEAFDPLVERFAKEVQFVSLQKHDPKRQLRASRWVGEVLDLSEQVDEAGHAFVDSLAVLRDVDLLITTDNGLAHVAGAAGIPSWVLLGTAPDWRWGLRGERTAWYPSLRLFRQSTSGDWQAVIDRVIAELEQRWRAGA